MASDPVFLKWRLTPFRGRSGWWLAFGRGVRPGADRRGVLVVGFTAGPEHHPGVRRPVADSGRAIRWRRLAARRHVVDPDPAHPRGRHVSLRDRRLSTSLFRGLLLRLCPGWRERLSPHLHGGHTGKQDQQARQFRHQKPYPRRDSRCLTRTPAVRHLYVSHRTKSPSPGRSARCRGRGPRDVVAPALP